MNKRVVSLAVGAMAALVVSAGFAVEWSSGAANFAPGDDVTVPAGATVVLEAATPQLGSFDVSGTVIVSNWTTRIEANQIVVRNGGTIKAGTDGLVLSGQLPNRVWLKGATLTVEAGGKVSADGAGFAGTNGPCWTASVTRTTVDSNNGRNFSPFGGVYGGNDGLQRAYYRDAMRYIDMPQPYGSAEWPYDAGSGGGALIRSGGGAVVLDFSGAVTVNGTVSANAGMASYTGYPAYESNGNTTEGLWNYMNAPYGSGGGVVVVCSTISGTGSVTANGGVTSSGRGGYGGGSGGRVAVHYTASAQSNAVCSVRFEARGGLSSSYLHGECVGDPGTLWFTDNHFLDSYAATGWTFAGTWMSGEGQPSSFTTAGDLVLAGGQLAFAEPMALTVGGNLAISGTLRSAELSGLIFASNATVTVGGDVTVTDAKLSLRGGGTVSVDGDFTMTADNTVLKGALLYLYAAATNGTENAYGLSFDVGGLWTVGKNAVVSPACHPTDGAIPALSAGDFTLDAAGVINAAERGYKKGPGYGSGSYRGSGYGGLSGGANQGLVTYGSREEPLDPGSGDNQYGSGSCLVRGGGVVYLTVRGDGHINGKILADATDETLSNVGKVGYCCGASGGSIYLRVKHLYGDDAAVVRAMGGGPCGSYNSSYLGGGGRVAIWTLLDDSNWKANWTAETVAPVKYMPTPKNLPEAGTLYWGTLPSTQIAVDATPARYGTVTPAWGLSDMAATGQNNVFDIVRKTFDDGRTAVEIDPGHRVFVEKCEVVKDGEVDAASSVYPFAWPTPTSYTTISALWTFTNEQYAVFADAQGFGTVRFDGGVAGPMATNWVAAGATVVLTATADATHNFVNWSGDGITAANGTQNPITLTTHAAPMNLTAHFVSIDPTHDAADVVCDDGPMPELGLGDRVTVPDGKTVVLDVSTARLGLLDVSGTLVVSNWATRIDADTIIVRSGGVIKAGTDGFVLSGQMPNRVWLRGASLTVEEGGRIDADAAGFAGTNGPCWTVDVARAPVDSANRRNISPWGGCYGGRGGYYRYHMQWNRPHDWQNGGNSPQPYGSAEWPYDAGSGGGAFVRSGGGAIFLDFTGSVTIDGVVSADASAAMYTGFPAGESAVVSDQSWNYVNASYGSGGGIVIVCSSVAGTGTVSASSALAGADLTRTGYGGGSGGRIAVHYNAAAQRSAACAVRFRARGGVSHKNGQRGAWYGDPGTLWFTDNQFLDSYAAAGWTFAGTWNSGVGAPTGYTTDGNLTVLDAQVRFPAPFSLRVGGELCVTGTVRFATANGLFFGAAATVDAGSVTVAGAKLAFEAGGSLEAAADIQLADGSDAFRGALLSLQAGATNGLDGAYGFTCTAGGKISVGRNAVLLPYCHLTCGAIPAFFCRDLYVDAAGIVDASSKGYLDKGPITVDAARGSSHGGLGGGKFQALPCYDSETEPMMPGCGDCYGIRGGGVVFLNVSHRARIYGQILADAKDPIMIPDGDGLWHSGASGGSIHLRIQRLVGGDAALVRAMGGGPGGYHVGDPGKGGGGRIAIWAGTNQSNWRDNSDRVSAVAYQTGSGVDFLPQDGTVYWGDLPLPGMLFLVK